MTKYFFSFSVFLFALVNAFWGVRAYSQETPQVFVGGRLILIEGEDIPNGIMIVQNGKITALGAAQEVSLPVPSVIHNLAGRTIMPGFVDTHSHIGGGWAADRSAPIQPDVRVLDSIDARNSGFQRAQAGGITTANVMPGSGHLLSGQTLYLKMRDANTINDLLIYDKEGEIVGGVKMANGTNSIRQAPFPGTRSKSAALVREKFIQAQEYLKKIELAGDDKSKIPPRDLALETLGDVLQGKKIVHHHTHRHDDILTVLRLQKEFQFRVVLHHVSDAWKVAKEIAEAKAPCSLIYIDSPGGKLEARDIDWKNGAILEKAGASVAFHTDDWITDSRLFLRSAAFAVRAGMSKKGALRGLTLAGAEMLDLQDRIGSLKLGKDADFVILSGDPLSVYTKIEQTWIDGNKVFDRKNPQDRLWAVGGYKAGLPREGELCCFGKENK